jgi:hypothetical protein
MEELAAELAELRRHIESIERERAREQVRPHINGTPQPWTPRSVADDDRHDDDHADGAGGHGDDPPTDPDAPPLLFT